MKKKKISKEEKLRREIQSQRAKQGYVCIGNYESGKWKIENGK